MYVYMCVCMYIYMQTHRDYTIQIKYNKLIAVFLSQIEKY